MCYNKTMKNKWEWKKCECKYGPTFGNGEITTNDIVLKEQCDKCGVLKVTYDKDYSHYFIRKEPEIEVLATEVAHRQLDNLAHELGHLAYEMGESEDED